MQRSGETVLIFPVSTDRSLDYAAAASNRGDRVVGASSLPTDPLRPAFALWEYLPFFDHPEFEARLLEVIDRHGVTLIHSPHLVVWQKLKACLPRLAPATRLDQTLPWHSELDHFRRQRNRVERIARGELASCRPPSPALAPLEQAALLAQVETVPGWCSGEKVWMMIDMFRHAPPGDVVEIGTFCGKSAVALAWLAQRHEIGNLLCIDPWTAADMAQSDPAVNSATATLDLDEIFAIFRMVMAAVSRDGGCNYLRLPSDRAAEQYRPGLVVETPEFGATEFSGRIAVLHVDGNHDQDQVRRDLDFWGDKVVPGGWIIIDDYVHAFGQGPRIIGDEFVLRRWDRIAGAVVSGSALFIQIRE